MIFKKIIVQNKIYFYSGVIIKKRNVITKFEFGIEFVFPRDFQMGKNSE